MIRHLEPDELTVIDTDPAEVFAAAPEDEPAITHARLTGQPRDGHTDTTSLPEPWRMSIAELDSWERYYSQIERAGLPIYAAESAHRDEVERNIRLRHDARRFTINRRG